MDVIDSQLKLARKLAGLRADLKPLKTRELSNISERAFEAKAKLESIQGRVDQDPLNAELRMQELEARNECIRLNSAEFSLSQRVKSLKLNLSDRNTKFFHSLVKSNSARNSISFIRRLDGSIIGDMNKIIGDFSTFYYDLFGKTSRRLPLDWDVISRGEVLRPKDQTTMVRKITSEEIKAAIFKIGNEKAPGPDGFPAGFYKKNWDVVREDVINAVNEFFDKGLILRELNHTAITLIPKKSHEPTVVDFRPIACTNVVYKAITKIITSRMAPVLQKIISSKEETWVITTS